MIKRGLKFLKKSLFLLLVLTVVTLPLEKDRAQGQTIEQIYAELTVTFTALGLSLGEGLSLMEVGLARGTLQWLNTYQEVAEVAQQIVRQQIHQQGTGELIRHNMRHNARFMRTVLNKLRDLVNQDLIKPSNARRALRKAGTWTRRSGSVDLSTFFRALALIIVAVASGYVGYQTGKAWVYEMSLTADAAEENAYAELLHLLIKKTTKGNLQLCNNMTYAEAGTRLRINMRTSPGKPFWGIICKKGASTGVSFSGTWTCRNNGFMNITQAGSNITGSLQGFDGGKKGNWGKGHREGGVITSGRVNGKTMTIFVTWNDGTTMDATATLTNDMKGFSGSWTWFKSTRRQKAIDRGSWNGTRK